MEPIFYLISGYGTSTTCWERWVANLKELATIVTVEIPSANDKSKIGKIRLDDYVNKIVESVSSEPGGKRDRRIVVAHSSGGIALLKAIEKVPSLFEGVDVILLSSVSPKGVKLVFNFRVFLGFFTSMLKAFPVWGRPVRLDPVWMKWLLTDGETFSEAERNRVTSYFQPYVSGSMGVEMLLNLDSLKVNIDKVTKTIGRIIVINARDDKFGDTKKLAQRFNSLYVETAGSHFSYFAGTQVDKIIGFIKKIHL
jgi:predicted alpha/beta hydrolase family esterase